MPMNRALYPHNWKKISRDIIQKAGDRCEWCGLTNHSVGVRTTSGKFVATPHLIPGQTVEGYKVIKIVLTVAHIYNPDPMDCRPENLAALCCQCHNKHDAPMRARNAKTTKRRRREQSGQLTMEVMT